MELIQVVLYLVGGGLILSYGAHLFVEASSHFARRMGISPLIIGLTIVSAGTSAPELAVNVLAAYQGNADIALGNVVGSNIFNVAIIIGLCAIVSPLIISQQLIRLDIPIMVAGCALTWWFGRNNVIEPYESMILALGFIGYNWLQIKLARKEKKQVEQEYKEAFSATGSPLKDGIKLLVGLILLVVGAKLFVDGAIIGARFLGWSEAVIALTIIAAGTSLPEVATSVVATMKGERDIAVGNVVGSNIFNILAVLGFSGVLVPKGLTVNTHMVEIDIPLMIIIAAVCVPLAFWRQKFDRLVGVLFVMSYIAYTYYLISSTG